jgi:DNA-binding Xre family transcriptional regulator
MIQWTLAKVLKDRKWTAYRLAQQAGLTMPSAYKLADPDHVPDRIDVETLDKICDALNVQPSKFLKWKKG